MKKLKLLLVDDDPLIIKGTGSYLDKKNFMVTTADSGEKAVELLDKTAFDLVITDLVMDRVDGIGVLQKSKEVNPEAMNIILTGHGNLSSAINALRLGADDYLLKPCDGKEMLLKVSSCFEKLDLKKKIKHSKEALRNSEEKLRAIMNAAADAIILLDDRRKIIFSNPASETIFGYSAKELKESEIQMLFEPDELYELLEKRLKEYLETGQESGMGKVLELTSIKKNKTRFPVEVSVSGLKINGQWHAVGFVRDITQIKKMQDENIRAEKLESLGILAGGIVHDFNNLLFTIMGNIELAEDCVKTEIGISEFLENAVKASLKAKKLTGQFAMLSLGSMLVRKTGSIKELLRESKPFFLSQFHIKYDFSLADDLWQVEFDNHQLTQAIRNLLINAAESMPHGGMIVVKAENIDAETAGLNRPLLEGKYIKIIIRDSGIGIPDENLTRIFDPYFSTKTRGTQKGMGLGLTIAWSVITRHGGRITVESKLGLGTIVAIYLPVFF
ncbi:response regulator [Desulfobacterales bacterium HSG17]|nr:response regulator [Desulfobacterales bacterium HSG17]